MHFTSAELTALVGGYLWPFFRIASMLMAMPIIGVRTVSTRIRVALAVVLTLVIAPVIPEVPVVEPISGAGLMVIFQQVLIGVAMGFILQMVFAIFVVGAQVISMQMGLGFATMVDPQSGASVPVVGQFFTIMVTLVFLTLDGHLVLIEMVADSFQTLPISSNGIGAGNFWMIVSWAGQIFTGAVMIAMPAIAALLFVNMSFGVMTRASPQFNILAVGFPITLILGFMIIYLTLPGVLGHVEPLFWDAFSLIKLITGGI